jgi:hypothetical protein
MEPAGAWVKLRRSAGTHDNRSASADRYPVRPQRFVRRTVRTMAIASSIEARRSERVVRLGVALLALVQLATAVWIVVAPHAFFDDIGPFGAYNSHYVDDAAAFQAGLGVALAAGLVVPAVRAGALAAMLASTGLHALNHWIDVNDAHPGSSAGVGDAVALTILFVFTAALTRAAIRTNGSVGRDRPPGRGAAPPLQVRGRGVSP